jgi:hypothetical protein
MRAARGRLVLSLYPLSRIVGVLTGGCPGCCITTEGAEIVSRDLAAHPPPLLDAEFRAAGTAAFVDFIAPRLGRYWPPGSRPSANSPL